MDAQKFVNSLTEDEKANIFYCLRKEIAPPEKEIRLSEWRNRTRMSSRLDNALRRMEAIDLKGGILLSDIDIDNLRRYPNIGKVTIDEFIKLSGFGC